MSYSDCLARISQLDALLRVYDPTWASSGLSLVNVTGTGSSTSPFASVLTAEATSATTSTTSTSSPAKAAVHPVIKPVGATTFVSPLPGSRITQPFGPTDVEQEPSATVDGVTYAHYHNGIDMAAALGTPVLAAADGVVSFAGKQSDGAIVVKIRHDDNDNYETLYGHLDPNLPVKVGQRVSIGQVIGKVGLTGVTTGPHLHFSVWSYGTWVDPSASLESGHLPDPVNLMGPSASDPGAMIQVSGATTLAHFDAISSQIPYAAQIRAAAVAAGIDPTLLAGLVYAESSFRPAALSPCGAMGLTQLMPSTAKSLGVDPWDIQQNLNGGAKYIGNLLTRFGRTDLALAAYNAGPNAISRLGVVPDSKKPYVTKILTKWQSYQELAA